MNAVASFFGNLTFYTVFYRFVLKLPASPGWVPKVCIFVAGEQYLIAVYNERADDYS